MDGINLETTFLKILKRLMLIAIGSGLLSNALYIYGLAYYQGYISGLGFEYDFFPIEWSDSLIWTYSASRELGANTIGVFNKLTGLIVFVFLLAFYLIARLWMELSKPKNEVKKKKPLKKLNFKLAKKIYLFKSNYLWTYRLAYLPIRWVLLKEQSFIAFLASYFFMVFLFFIPIFILIWVYFPIFGVNQGLSVAKVRLDSYQEYLCGDKSDYWNKCIQVLTESSPSKKITGRLLFKNVNLIGIITKTGPITMSMPKIYHHKTLKNPNFISQDNK